MLVRKFFFIILDIKNSYRRLKIGIDKIYSVVWGGEDDRGDARNTVFVASNRPLSVFADSWLAFAAS